MYKFFLIPLVLIFSVASAGAHHYRHRHHGFWHNDVIGREPYPAVRSRNDVAPPPESNRDRAGSLIPSDWTKQPFDHPGSNRSRFISPDGSASFDFYTTAVQDEPITKHMKNFAFGDGDEITYLAAERTWIAASGFKGDRLFYGKAALACGGDRWHHIAFEYPANAKRNMQDFVRRAVDELDRGENAGCDTPLSNSANDGDAQSAEQSAHTR
jgi:hypothetical protein